jgi:hypothetical protein
MKALNQQREQKTRDNLKIAYESMFGARDRRVSNMAADFGYVQNPAGANFVDLRFMTTSNAPNGSGAVPQAYSLGGAVPFFWGWNGPYWTGSTTPATGTNGIPVDGWGRAIRLYNGPRLVSAGVDGNYRTADDISYPTVTGLPTTTLVVNLIRQNPGAPPPSLAVGNVQVTVIHRAGNSSFQYPLWQPAWGANNASQPFTWNPNPGPVSITIKTPTIASSQQIVDLLPGQTQTINFTFFD